jgi:IS30 family transposase
MQHFSAFIGGAVVSRRYKRRRVLAAGEHNALWARRGRGETLLEIARALDCSKSTLYWVIAGRGGVAPRPRRRAPVTLSLAEREEISRGLAAEDGVRVIARRLGRAPSTISREIHRHGGPARYRARVADAGAWQRARRPKRCRLARHRRLRATVAAKLRVDWSPQQIAEWLKRTYPDDATMHVSHETIYRTLYVQARGALKQELTAHLRRRRRIRQSRGAARRGSTHGQLVDIVSISERPPTVEDRAVPGHWEGDLLAGGKRSQIATLIERQSRFVELVRVPARDSETVVRALARRVQRLPTHLKQSLTWDRGKEMAQHKEFTVATQVQVYFCDPRSPWQRGSNENTNGLLRQYFPKGMDLTNVTQRQLDAVALKLNTRPRETLGWRTPAEALATTVAPTG